MMDWPTPKYTLALTLTVLAVCIFSPPVNAQSKVVGMEYYVDLDPGQGMGVPIPSADGSFDSSDETGSIEVDTAGWIPGPHMIYVRALSSTGAWGTYPMKLVYINDPQTRILDRVEYFFDIDPGAGKGTPMSAVDGIIDENSERMIASDIDISALAQGDHVLYVRARDKAGIWGPVRSNPFEVLSPITVKSVEVGLGKTTDTEPSDQKRFMQPIDGQNDSSYEDLTVSLNAPTQSGTHRIFIRAMNNELTWSDWQTYDLTVSENPEPTATPTVTPTPGIPTPTPTEPIVYPTPTPVNGTDIIISPFYVNYLDGITSEENNLMVVAPGNGDFSLADYTFSLIDISAEEERFCNGFGLSIHAYGMEGILAYAVPVTVESDYVLARISLRCSHPSINVVVGMLDAVPSGSIFGAQLNGSIGYNYLVDTSKFVNQFGWLDVILPAQRGAVVPFIQVANLTENSGLVKVEIDNFKIYRIPRNAMPVFKQ